MVSAMIAYAPDPESGRRIAIGTASAGKPTRLNTGCSPAINTSSRPEARNMPAATMMATRKGMIRMAT